MGATYDADWADAAACRGHGDLFFRPAGVDPTTAADRLRVKKAQAICATCPVQRECALHAMRNRETHGVWAGVDLDRTPHAEWRLRR